MLEKTESQIHPVGFDDIELAEDIEDTDVHKWATELYDVLSLLLRCDAFAIARGAPDMSGVESLRRVCKRHSPSIPSSALRDKSSWRGAQYEQVRDRIKAMVTNRMSMESGPIAMEVGDVGGEYSEYSNEDIRAVGKGGTCCECGETGHFARDCVLRGWKKGSGKGGKGRGYAAWSAGKGKLQTARRQCCADRVRARLCERSQEQGPDEGPVLLQRPVPGPESARACSAPTPSRTGTRRTGRTKPCSSLNP